MISGLLVAAGGMFYALLVGIAVLGISVAHLAFVRVEERPESESAGSIEQTDMGAKDNKIDLRGTLRIVRGFLGCWR